MLTFEQVISSARKGGRFALLGSVLVIAAPVWAQETSSQAANHAAPKVMTPVSLPAPADQVEVSAPVGEIPLIKDDSQQKAKPSQSPRPGSAGGQAQMEGKPRYGDANFVGEIINLNVVDADIRDVLNYVTEQYGVNFVIDSSIRQGEVKISVNVNNVPWNIALNAILRANGLGVDINGPILRVAKSEVLAKEAELNVKAEDNILNSKPLFTDLIRLNYARPTSDLVKSSENTQVFTGGVVQGSGGSAGGGGGSGGILPIIQRRLSRRGSIEFDGRSNSLIVTDVKDNLEAVRKLVELLDKPEPQVEIEARIVIANRNFSRDLGVQLSALALGSRGQGGSFATTPGSASQGTGTGNTTGVRPGGIPVGIGVEPTRSLLANLPNSILGLTTGVIGTAQISLLLSAAEQKGQAKVVASPRVTALNNRPAQIESGQQIPVVTPQTGAGNSGAIIFTTTFVSVPLRLSVTPQITDAGTVVLRIVAENNSINTAVAINGTPGIDTQRMSSEVLVPDGGTTVVGGVLADSESEIQNRTPGVSSIPILGNMFKRKAVSRQTNEILFFITPRIYRPDYQGNPMSDVQKATGTRVNTISQPVPLGNPNSNTAGPNGEPQLAPADKPAPEATPKKPNNN